MHIDFRHILGTLPNRNGLNYEWKFTNIGCYSQSVNLFNAWTVCSWIDDNQVLNYLGLGRCNFIIDDDDEPKYFALHLSWNEYLEQKPGKATQLVLFELWYGNNGCYNNNQLFARTCGYCPCCVNENSWHNACRLCQWYLWKHLSHEHDAWC